MSWQSSETKRDYVSHIEPDMSRLAQISHMLIERCYLYPECCVCHWDPSQSLGWELMQKWLNGVNHCISEATAPRLATGQVFWKELFQLLHWAQPTEFYHAGKGLVMQLAAPAFSFACDGEGTSSRQPKAHLFLPLYLHSHSLQCDNAGRSGTKAIQTDCSHK